MKRKNETDALNDTISSLENKQDRQLQLLKNQFHLTYESLKPINIIKNAFHEIAESPEIRNNLLGNVIGLTTGYLSKIVLVGASHNPIKKIFGTLLQFGITNVVSKHSDTIKSAGETILQRIFKQKEEAMQELESNENESIKK